MAALLLKILVLVALAGTVLHLTGSSSVSRWRRGYWSRRRREVYQSSTDYENSTRQSPTMSYTAMTTSVVTPNEDMTHRSSVSTHDPRGNSITVEMSSVSSTGPRRNATLVSSVWTRDSIMEPNTSLENMALASSMLTDNSTNDAFSEDMIFGSSEVSTRHEASDGLVPSVTPHGLNTIVWAQTQVLMNTAATTAHIDPDPRTCLDVMTSTGLTQDGYFFIDPDGPHGAPKFQVFCRLNPSKDGQGTTVVRTTSSDTVFVQTNSEVTIVYDGGAGIDSIRELVKASKSCRQYLNYDCYDAPMWWNGNQQVAWVSWDGTVMPNWGGAPTGFPGCNCSSQEQNACSGGGRCHCDSGSGTDGGFITDEDTLPVAKLQFHFSDDLRASRRAGGRTLGMYRVGNLRCTGNDPPTAADASRTTESEETMPTDGTTTEQPEGITTDVTTTADTYTTTEGPATRPSSTPLPDLDHGTTQDYTTGGLETTTLGVKRDIDKIGASLMNRFLKFKISAGNTSTLTLRNVTKIILREVLNFLSSADSVNQSTTLTVATLLETSMTKIAFGLQVNESLQLMMADTKVELTSFSSSGSLNGYVFSVGGGGGGKDSTVDGGETKDDENEETQGEVTLKISTPTFSRREGPVKVVVVYHGAGNRTGRKADEEETNKMSSSRYTAVNSGILTCSVFSDMSEARPLAVALDFSLQHQTHSAEGDDSKLVRRSCVFWNTAEERWSTDGCQTIDSVPGVSSTKTFCSCNHNSSFAVLLQVSDRPVGSHDQNSDSEYILSVLSTVLGALSVFCLASTLILYTYLKLFKFLQIKVHANLAGSLLTAQILFITGVKATENHAACRVITVLLQFFFSATFFWMLVEGGLLFQRAALVSKQPPKLLLLLLIGWGLPFLLTLVSFAIGFRHYGSFGLCWLSTKHGQIWAFLSLVIIVILVNIAVVIFVMKTFLSLKMNTDKDNAERIRASVRAVVVLVPILGLAWMLGFLQDISPIFHLAFVILNASQGIFVFICHGLMNVEVLKAIKRRRRNKVSACSDSGGEHTHSHISSKETGTTGAVDRCTKKDRM